MNVKDLHETYGIADAHLDLGGIILSLRRRRQDNILRDYFLSHWRAAKVRLIVAAIYVDDDQVDQATKAALRQIVAIKEEIEKTDGVVLVTTRKGLEEALQEDKIAIILSLEGAEPIGRELGFLQVFYDLGVRAMGLTWSRRNYVADGSYFGDPEEGTKGGLTPFGIKVVRKAEELGIILDVSHLNDVGFADLLALHTKPFIASHSNARAIHGITRNLRDDQLKAIAKAGGFCGVNAFTSIVAKDPEKQTIEGLCDHLEHLIKVMGPDHVGYGFDLCQLLYQTTRKIDILADHEEAIEITKELIKRGLQEEVIGKVMGKSIIDFYLRYLP